MKRIPCGSCHRSHATRAEVMACYGVDTIGTSCGHADAVGEYQDAYEADHAITTATR